MSSPLRKMLDERYSPWTEDERAELDALDAVAKEADVIREMTDPNTAYAMTSAQMDTFVAAHARLAVALITLDALRREQRRQVRREEHHRIRDRVEQQGTGIVVEEGSHE